MRAVAIGELVEPVNAWNPASKPEQRFNYVDLSAVSQVEKRITSATSLRGAEAPSRARQLIRKGDILVSTVRPNLNGVAPVTSEYDGVTASTGFCVLRPHRSKLASCYLMHWVKSPTFVEQMVRQATGASYPAVSDRIVKASTIPLPPLDEQRRIAAILDKADALRRKRRRALDLLDELTQSIFLEMFGDPLSISSGWRRVDLGEIAEKITDGEHQTPRRALTGVFLLSARNIQMGYIDVSDVDYVDDVEFSRISKRISPAKGDVLISCSGTIGRVATLRSNQPLSLVRSVALVRPSKGQISSTYLEYYLRTPQMQSTMKRSANSSGQPNLFQAQIRRLPILLPPLTMQESFSHKIASLAPLSELFEAERGGLDALFTSLQHRAFTGEL